jgi:hypothetical protein
MTVIRLRDLVAPAPTFPLHVPTYDGLPGLLHTDLIHVPEGWNGWRYWLAYTPYPDAARENISIAVSNNLNDWRDPGTNPLLTRSQVQALGNYGHNSDPDIVLLPTGGMRIYFRPAGTSSQDESVWCMDTSDGVTWGTPAKLLEEQAANNKLLSPAVVVEADGTFSMWTVNLSVGELQRRTSPDGLDWSAPPVGCTIPNPLWHPDVVLFAGRYHMLMNSKDPGDLYFRWSDDGTTWHGTATSLPAYGTYAGRSFDGYYRSSMVPAQARQFGQHATWDVVASLKHPRIGGMTDVEVALVRGVSLSYAL